MGYICIEERTVFGDCLRLPPSPTALIPQICNRRMSGHKNRAGTCEAPVVILGTYAYHLCWVVRSIYKVGLKKFQGILIATWGSCGLLIPYTWGTILADSLWHYSPASTSKSTRAIHSIYPWHQFCRKLVWFTGHWESFSLLDVWLIVLGFAWMKRYMRGFHSLTIKLKLFLGVSNSSRDWVVPHFHSDWLIRWKSLGPHSRKVFSYIYKKRLSSKHTFSDPACKSSRVILTNNRHF
jgi:hypothetical protein